MVRSNELGCRNGWNADLWVDGSTQRDQPHDSIGGKAKAEVGPAEPSDLITSIVAAKTDNVSIADERPVKPSLPQAAIEEDIFVKQTPSMTWSTGPISTQPATELVQDPKAAILRARDQFRQRRKNEGRLADRQIPPAPASLLASAREAQLVDDLDLTEPEPAPETVDPRYENRPIIRPANQPLYGNRRPVSPVSLREVDRPFPSLTDFPEDRARFESVPSLQSPDDRSYDLDAIAEAPQDDAWIETRQIDTVPPEPYEVDELFEEDEVVTYAEAYPGEDEELSVHHRESAINRFLRLRRERKQALPDFDQPAYDEPVPIAALAPLYAQDHYDKPIQRSEAWFDAPSEYPELPGNSASGVQPNALESRRPSVEMVQTEGPPVALRAPRTSETVADIDDDFVIPPPLPEIDPPIQGAASSSSRARPRMEPTQRRRNPEPRHQRIEQPIEDEFGDKPLFAASPSPPVGDYEIDPSYDSSGAAVALSFRLERICQTCRDFRPAENGERGWCNNKWAFNHRRMVDAEDLACRNSLGSWWTPKDDVWRRDGDISRHAQHTPRVDQWLLGSNLLEESDRRRSGS